MGGARWGFEGGLVNEKRLGRSPATQESSKKLRLAIPERGVEADITYKKHRVEFEQL